MLLAIRSRVKTPTRPQNAADLCQRLCSIWYMIEHVICDNGVKMFICKRNCLSIGLLKREAPLNTLEMLERFLQHAWREIRHDNIPAFRNTIAIFAP